MAGATDGDAIYFTELGDEIDPVQESANQASSIQNALNNRVIFTYRWPTVTEKTAQADMVGGEYGYLESTDTPYIYISDNLGWRPVTFGSSRTWAKTFLLTPAATKVGNYFEVITPVTFPPGLFSATPVINVSPHTSVPQNVFASFTEPTSSGCKLVLRRTDSATATTIHLSLQQEA